MKASLSNFLNVFSLLRPTEKAFSLLSISMALMFARFDTDFAKLGLPLSLPGYFGGLPGQAPKLFMMEIFLLVSALIFVAHVIFYRNPVAPAWKDPLWLSTVVAFFLGITRILTDISDNPVLVIRNSCFIWYLFLPLAAFHAGISSRAFRWIATGIAMGIAVFFLVGVTLDFLWNARPAIQWFLPGGGVVGLILVIFLARPKKYFLATLPLIALAVGSMVYSPCNRTTILAQLSAFAFVFFIFRERSARVKRFLFRVSVLVLLAAGASFLWGARIKANNPNPRWPDPHEPIPLSRQIFHSEATSGVESYRWEMWKDAWGLFLSEPLRGVGFSRQIVFRLYEGVGNFIPNDTESMKGPPVSGPHNSYLNALARLGFGGILFLVMHVLSLAALWRARENVAFWLVWAQVFYATLNVALEGPVRSFILLLFLGMALRVNYERKASALVKPVDPAMPAHASGGRGSPAF